MIGHESDYDHHEVAEWCVKCGALLTGNESRGRTCNDCLDADSKSRASVPPLRAVCYGCFRCGAMVEAGTMRQLYREAFERWRSDPSRRQQIIAEHLCCPECDAPGALVKVELSMPPGVFEWKEGRGDS